jgi:hypothetical protein
MKMLVHGQLSQNQKLADTNMESKMILTRWTPVHTKASSQSTLEASLKGVNEDDAAQSAIWDVCSGTGIDAYELHDPDALHLFWSGIAKYLVTDGLVVLKQVGKESAILELDRRAKNLFRCVRSPYRTV